ncbi:major facilitator transporter [Microbacterium sp. MEJ108Y]|uniref:MFS transporter n=1 Tax=Microbacterium sp. MEJ108Y TaxID=1587523 RepID=UPI0005ACEB8C|nr:MFS transporter [Microbacterium sp. MEJ108Y]KIP90371.1 major facilitator transporter [Microbacterium sp. MEJ108Y]
MTTTAPITTTPGPASAIRRPRFGFALAIVTQIAMMTGASAPSPFYPVLAAEIGFDAIVISAVFAVYAIALLLALLSAGSLSDHIGRRPVAIGGLLLLAGSMLLFWHADSVATLMLARILQGAASGVLIAALSAAALDLAPGGRSRVAALWNALSPGIGLALGALVSGIALDVTGQPLLDVFAPLTVIYLALAALFFLAPETAPLHPGAWGSLSFRLSVPAGIRSDFWRGAPAIIAGWATGGLFLSLGANIVRTELGGDAHVWQGLAVAMLAGIGAITAFVFRNRRPRTSVIFGTAALATGTALSLIALSVESLPFYLAATAVTGMGFGTAFSGVVASLAPRIPATDRADTFAVIYLLAYLAFGVPAVVAGTLVGVFELGAVCVGYGVVVIVLAVVALVLRVRRAE